LNSPPKFSDFSEEPKKLDGEKVSIDSILNKEILITGFKIGKSKYKENSDYTTVQFVSDDINHVFFTGSSVIADQIKKYGDKIPFTTTVQKINKYYTLT